MVNISTILTVVECLMQKPTHTRSIAKHAGKSHATIIPALNQLETQHAVTYTIEGRNKRYSLTNTTQARTYMHMAEQHKVLKTIKKYPEISIIAEKMRKQTDAKILVLFGSYAKHEADKNSDIDMYVSTNSIQEKKQLEKLHSRLRIKIGTLDPSNPLTKEIIKDGVIFRGIEEFYDTVY